MKPRFVCFAISLLFCACARKDGPALSAEQPDSQLTPAARVAENPPASEERNTSASTSASASEVTPQSDTPESAAPIDTEQLASASPAQEGPAAADEDEPRTPDVVYVPTPQLVVDKMLELVAPQKGEILYDLGCGDGRIVVTAAKRYGVKAFGFDIDPDRIREARENVRVNKLEQLVTIRQKDIFSLDLSKANIVTLYLLPQLNVRLIPQLQKLKPGSRVVSHDFDMAGVSPVKQLSIKVASTGRDHSVFLWRAPIRKDSSFATSAAQ